MALLMRFTCESKGNLIGKKYNNNPDRSEY